jgi:catechol 2,3-dioxygenase-like lactoylglutathione lyase family enzyme
VPHLHHVNLGVPTGGIDAQTTFLVDVLGFRHVEPHPELVGRAHWFDDDAGVQVHLSADPEHRPAARAHVALSIDDLETLEKKLDTAGVEFTSSEFDGLRILFCQDPAGNRWELRGALVGA